MLEAMRPRTTVGLQQWIIKNSTGNERCIVTPGPTDGNFDKYSLGDVWFLRNKFPLELDDGVNCTSGCETRTLVGNFINAESLSGVDIVMWYGGHFLHDAHDENSETGNHVLGPTIAVQGY
jgi:hypothetical protein